MMTNETLIKLINKHLKNSPIKQFVRKVWEYGKNRLLVCGFIFKNVGFAIDISPANNKDDKVSLKLCWRKPYEIYSYKLEYKDVISASEIGTYLDKIVLRCIDFINANSDIKVSVIVSVSNAEYLALSRLINSFKSQTMPKNQFEIIYVGNNSLNKSIEVIKKLSHGLKYEILELPINSGNYNQARNSGIIAAKGIYSFFVNSEDYIENDCLLSAYSYAIDNKSDIVYLRSDSIFGHINKSALLDGLKSIDDADIYRDHLLQNTNCFKLFKTIMLRKNNIFFDNNISFIVAALCNADKVSIIKDKSFYLSNLAAEIDTNEFSDNLFKNWITTLEKILVVNEQEKKRKLYNCLLCLFAQAYYSSFDNLLPEQKNVIFSILKVFRKHDELFDISLIYHECKEYLSKFNWPIIYQGKNNQPFNDEDSLVGIMNFHFANNFGAVLVPFSLMRTIQRMGFNAEVINYAPKEIPIRKHYVEFRKNFLNISEKTKLLNSKQELENTTSKYDKIVVGSDQVWRLFDTSTYMLDFAHGYKTLISYAASFGGSTFTKLSNERAITLLNRFDAISVRENTGVDICNNQFGIPAMHVLDPTLLLTANEYQQIIDYFKPKSMDSQYIAYSIINKSNKEHVSALIDRLSKVMNIKFRNILSELESEEVNSVGGWLNDIKNSSYVITDSFHATVFAILYKKKFICLVTGANGTDRIPSLLKMLDIDCSSRVVNTLNLITPELLNNVIDYDHVYERLNTLRNKSILFLKNALNKPKNFKQTL